MKTEINNENKAKFFALYWGLILWGTHLNENVLIRAGHLIDSGDSEAFKTGYLNLKPLSQVGDEHIQWIKKICEYKSDLDVAGFIRTLEGKWFNRKNVPHYKVLMITDFLRSNGFALPWMGLSIDDMREAGWIKLIGE